MKPSTHPLLDLNPPDMSLFNEIYKTPQMDQITPGQPATIIDESFSPFQRESPLDTSTSFDKIGLFSPFKKEVKQSDPEVHQPNSIFDSFAKRTSLLTTAVPQFSLFQQELHSGFNSNFNPVDVKSNTIMDSHSNDNTNRFESYGSSVMKNTKQPIITLNSQQEMSFQNIPRTHSAMLIQNVEPFMPPQWMYRDLSGQIQGNYISTLHLLHDH